MRRIALKRVRFPVKLGKTIFVDGRPLLRVGVMLTERLASRLRELGIQSVYIQDPEHDDIDIPESDLLSEETRRKAFRVLKEQLVEAARSNRVDLKTLGRVANTIIDEVLKNRRVLLQLKEVQALDDYIFNHSISVCAGAVLLGIHSGMNERDLKTLAMGALLHDVGKVRIPLSILNKPGKLTPKEYQEVQKHPAIGFEILRQHREISILAAHVAYQHHERYDGSGYPRALVGEAIHRFARIVAIVDVFDALTSDRPYRPAWPFHRAVAFFKADGGKTFDPTYLRVFLGRVAPYPVGERVRLSTGDEALVVRLNPGTPGRPVVRLRADGSELDLSRELEVQITGPADESCDGAGAIGDSFNGAAANEAGANGVGAI